MVIVLVSLASKDMEERSERELLDWLDATGHRAAALRRMAGDVSRRIYYRVRMKHGGAFVLAVYPPAMQPTCRRFATTTRLLRLAGVRVPAIRLNDCSRGLALLEDVGSETLYDLRSRSWSELAPWIDCAAGILEAIATIRGGRAAKLNPPLDGPLLRRELDQTWRELFDDPTLGGHGAARERLRSALDDLCNRLGAAPQGICHRDFMARNLVPRPGGSLAVLDHQDLRLGPHYYDLASLLNDSLFAPPEIEERLVARFVDGCEGDHTHYRRCVVQRTLKAAGTFAAFARRGFRRHLVLIQPSLERAARHLRRLPEGRGLDENLLTAWRSFESG